MEARSVKRKRDGEREREREKRGKEGHEVAQHVFLQRMTCCSTQGRGVMLFMCVLSGFRDCTKTFCDVNLPIWDGICGTHPAADDLYEVAAARRSQSSVFTLSCTGARSGTPDDPVWELVALLFHDYKVSGCFTSDWTRSSLKFQNCVRKQ